MEISPIFVHAHKQTLDLNTDEILRYMGCRGEVSTEVYTLAKRAAEVLKNAIACKACYRFASVDLSQSNCVDFGFLKLCSSALAKQLNSCTKVCIFAATIGVEADRLIMRAEREEPSFALALQAAGAAAIECYCDYLCANVLGETEVSKGLRMGTRFSVGYADLDLKYQKSILEALDATRKIGITLTDGCMMIPTKTVTAFVGMGHSCTEVSDKCQRCANRNCTFRKEEGK